mmetsp:Transcript_108858/g.289515  ORF Transcript_108858/g.289515 Transcript_108858/m.289515 type:complete len:306 (-) Transcript_108858:20-937(-)
MAAELAVTVYFDRELDLKSVKVLRRGATVRELKEELAREDPTGQASPEDFVLVPAQEGTDAQATRALRDDEPLTDALAELAVRTADDEAELAELDAGAVPPDSAGAAVVKPSPPGPVPCEYRVMQDTLFKKPGSDPTTGKVVKIARKVGSKVRGTGRAWTGPQGGEWVQLEPPAEKPGWLLVEGSSFGAPGPLLERVEAGEEPRMVLRAARPVIAAAMDNSNVEMRDIVVRPSTKVREAKGLIAGLFGLDRKGIIMSKPKDRSNEQSAGNIDNTGAESLLLDDVTMGEAGFVSGHDVPFVYMGKI